MHNESGIIIRGLICHKDVDTALVCYGSFLRHAQEPVRLILHDDGSLTHQDIERVHLRLQPMSIITKKTADAHVSERLKKYPFCAKFRFEHPLGLKLLDIPIMNEGDLLYCDSDILFVNGFKGISELKTTIESIAFVFDRIEAYSVQPKHLIGAEKLKLASRANAGMIFLRKKVYDLDFIEWFLSHNEFRQIPGLIEQTCWAALGARVGCQHFDPSQIIMMRPGEKLNQEAIAGHFISRHRHLLCKFTDRSNNDQLLSEPITIRTMEAKFCNFVGLSLSLGRAFLAVQTDLLLSKLQFRLHSRSP